MYCSIFDTRTSSSSYPPIEFVAIIVICALWDSTRRDLKSSQFECKLQENYKNDYFEKNCKSLGRVSKLEKELSLAKDEAELLRKCFNETKFAINKVMGVKLYRLEEEPESGE